MRSRAFVEGARLLDHSEACRLVCRASLCDRRVHRSGDAFSQVPAAPHASGGAIPRGVRHCHVLVRCLCEGDGLPGRDSCHPGGLLSLRGSSSRASGLTVQYVTLQVGMPSDKAQYIHRLGRTARAGSYSPCVHMFPAIYSRAPVPSRMFLCLHSQPYIFDLSIPHLRYVILVLCLMPPARGLCLLEFARPLSILRILIIVTSACGAPLAQARREAATFYLLTLNRASCASSPTYPSSSGHRR